MKIKKNNLADVFKAKESSIETMELKGYTLIDNLMVDNSGMGRTDELAHTKTQFEKELQKLIDTHGTLTAKLTSVGQFQVYVGLFKKTGKSKCYKVDNNTLRIDTDNGYIIRLHNTDILIFKDNTVTVNNGGYQTRTTKDRLNKYLPQGIDIYQKNFEWFIMNKGIISNYENNAVIVL